MTQTGNVKKYKENSRSKTETRGLGGATTFKVKSLYESHHGDSETPRVNRALREMDNEWSGVTNNDPQ